jgi:hypothetical protein
MDAGFEARAEADRARNEKEFRIKNNIPDSEWNLARQMMDDLLKKLFDDFWTIWSTDKNA